MRVLMLGKGWFPAQLGGLDRYYRQLFEQLPEARGVVVGPADDAPAAVTAVSDHAAPLAARALAFTRATRSESGVADLIDVHFALYAVLPLLSRGTRGKPLLVHFHGPWGDENAALGDTSWWRLRARRRVERAVYSRAVLIVTLTGAFRRVLVELYGVSPWKTAVVPPGVDLARFSVGDRSAARAQLGLAPDAFVVCCVRRLVPRMGLDVMIEAWAQELAGDTRARMLIAGDGELRGELERQIAARSLANSVILLGRVSDDDLLTLYRAADVNVVPSISFEGFGLVVLEAAACGTPSIVTRAGGLPEAIGGLGPDLTVPTGDAIALADRVNRAKRDLPSREETRAWAETHSWHRVAEAHRHLFGLLAASSGAASPEARKLRVVYVDDLAQLSEGALELVRLLPVLRDVDAHVILREEGLLVGRLLEAGVSVEVLPKHGRTRCTPRKRLRLVHSGAYTISETLIYSARLARRLRQLKPDLVHSNSLTSGIYGSTAARVVGLPAVWHLRAPIDANNLPPSVVWLLGLLTHYLPAVVICNSEATRGTLRSPERSVVVASVDSVATTPDRFEAARNAPLVFGMLGPSSRWQDQHVFLSAFAAAFPQSPHRAVVVGPALPEHAEGSHCESLRQLAAELGVFSRVKVYRDLGEIGDELRMIDVLVHASPDPEPFSQAAIQLMSAELATVAMREGTPEDALNNDIDRQFYVRGDITSLADILRRVASDQRLSPRLSGAGIHQPVDFSSEVAVGRIMQSYRVAARRRA